jgi:hypothetical protein
MTNQRLKELLTEIAKLKEIDNKYTERVAAEFDAKDFEDNAPEHEPDYLDFVNSGGNPSEWEIDMEALPTIAELEPGHPMYVEVECSASLDYKWANESL